MILSLALALLAGGGQPQPPSSGPPFRPVPPLRSLSGTEPPEPAIVRFRAGEARCGADVQRPTRIEEPFPAGMTRTPPERPETGPQEVRLGFRIAADGRPLAIRAEPRHDLPIATRDVAAAFAAWRFAPGAERIGCTIAFEIEPVPVSRADPETLHRFILLQPLGAAPNASVGRPAFLRTVPAGSTCFDPRPNVRLQAFPAFEEIPQPAGTASYAFVEYDIAADGSTRRARVTGSSGNRELDRQSLRAIGRTRYQPGTRKGCTYGFHRRQTDPMPAPESPPESAFRPDGATCPDERPAWVDMPALVFPDEFRRRGIEGWAMVRYDVAPSGATVGVEAVAAEPAAAFGEQAERIVRRARKAPTEGYAGCVVRVVFVLPARGAEAQDP